MPKKIPNFRNLSRNVLDFGGFQCSTEIFEKKKVEIMKCDAALIIILKVLPLCRFSKETSALKRLAMSCLFLKWPITIKKWNEMQPVRSTVWIISCIFKEELRNTYTTWMDWESQKKNPKIVRKTYRLVVFVETCSLVLSSCENSWSGVVTKLCTLKLTIVQRKTFWENSILRIFFKVLKSWRAKNNFLLIRLFNCYKLFGYFVQIFQIYFILINALFYL